MKKYIAFASTLMLAATAILFLDSCKKEEPDTETVSATDNAICEAEFTRLMPDVNGIAVNEEGTHNRVSLGNSVLSTCYTLSWSGDTALAVPGVTGHMFVDFGTTGTCQSPDGKTRKGMIEVIFDDGWRTIGSTDTIKLTNFQVNSGNGDVQYDGTVAVTWTDSFTYNYKVMGGKCTKGTAWTVLWDCDRTMKWVAGANDSIASNDVFQMWGTANGTNRESKTFTVDVTMSDCIVRRADCRYIVAGRLTLTPEGKNARTVDFGDGTCDDKANLIINGNSFEFTLQ